MDYPKFFTKLKSICRPLIYLTTVVILAFVLWQNVKPNVSFVYAFPKMPSIHTNGPVDKFNTPYPFYTIGNETFLKISRAQAFFEITLPGKFEKISFEIVHQNHSQVELNLQAPKEGENFLRLPLYNAALQQANNWSQIKDENGWILLQRPESQVKQFKSLEQFWQNPPIDRRILTFENIYFKFDSNVEVEKLKLQQLTEATKLNHIDYIVGHYNIPLQIGQWMVTNYTIDLPETLKVRGAAYKFHIEANGPEESKSFVKAIKITLHRSVINQL